MSPPPFVLAPPRQLAICLSFLVQQTVCGPLTGPLLLDHPCQTPSQENGAWIRTPRNPTLWAWNRSVFRPWKRPLQCLLVRVPGVEYHVGSVLAVSPKLTLLFEALSSPPRFPRAPYALATSFCAQPAFASHRDLTRTVLSALKALFLICL